MPSGRFPRCLTVILNNIYVSVRDDDDEAANKAKEIEVVLVYERMGFI
jgi:hypothetical protein